MPCTLFFQFILILIFLFYLLLLVLLFCNERGQFLNVDILNMSKFLNSCKLRLFSPFCSSSLSHSHFQNKKQNGIIWNCNYRTYKPKKASILQWKTLIEKWNINCCRVNKVFQVFYLCSLHCKYSNAAK